MNGRDLIIYILQNNLECARVEYIVNAMLKDFVVMEENLAVDFGVGVETIRTWYNLGLLEGFKIGEHLYFPKNVTDPRKGVICHETQK